MNGIGIVDAVIEAELIKERAEQHAAGGLSVFPLKLDGSKSPAVPSWNQYRTQIAATDELDELFGQRAGIAVVCGVISGGLEVLDFDDGSLLEPWFEQVAAIATKLPIIDTPSRGAHVYYRCFEVSGNHKIAVDPHREKKTLIETRGEGGYVVAPGSPKAVHSAGIIYCQFSGPRLPNVPTITPDERRQLWVAARTFDRSDLRQEYVKKKHREQSPPSQISSDPTAPWNEFQRGANWDEILLPHGWRTRDGEHWTRPGKDFGTSARVVRSTDGAEVLTVFSGNAGPLSPIGGYKTWGKFQAYAALNHCGDSRTAAKELRRNGFGGAK